LEHGSANISRVFIFFTFPCKGGSPYVGKDEQWLLDMLKDDYRMPCPDHVSEAL
jgi:hypothetical protein